MGLYMETEFRLYSNMDEGRDGGEVKPELCPQSNTVVVETKKRVEYRRVKGTRNRMKKNIRRSPECPNCCLEESTLELVDMRAEIQSCI